MHIPKSLRLSKSRYLTVDEEGFRPCARYSAISLEPYIGVGPGAWQKTTITNHRRRKKPSDSRQSTLFDSE
jgi:hypothetical protein